MSDNTTVSNTPLTDIDVRTSETSAGKHIQHFRLDLGSGSSESPAAGSVPTSVTGNPEVKITDGTNDVGVAQLDAGSYALRTDALVGAALTMFGYCTVSSATTITVDTSYGWDGASIVAGDVIRVSTNSGTIKFESEAVSAVGAVVTVRMMPSAPTTGGEFGGGDLISLYKRTRLYTNAAGQLDCTIGGSISVLTTNTTITNASATEDVALGTGHVGFIPIAKRRDNPSASAETSSDGDASYICVDQYSRLWTNAVPPQASGVGKTAVSATTGTATLMSAAPSRVGALVYNNSTSIMYLGYGSSVSSSLYTYRVEPFALFKVDSSFVGQVVATWVTATGDAQVTTW